MNILTKTVEPEKESTPQFSLDQVKKLLAIREKISEIERAVEIYQAAINRAESDLLVEA